jgi:DNA repair exonuclease SbcCD ATPase subunit
MFYTRNYANDIHSKDYKTNPTPTETFCGKLRATPRKNVLIEEKVKVSPKGKKKVLSLKSKSRNIEELNATYSVGRAGMFFAGKTTKNEGLSVNLQKRIRNLEEYSGLLKAKIKELEQNIVGEDCISLVDRVGEVDYKRYEDAAKELEEIEELYSTLSHDYARLKRNEEDLIEKSKEISKEKEVLIAESEKKASQQRVKIMLLQEALTKRNEELNIAKKELESMVSLH